MKGGYTLDQLPAHCRAGADRCYAVPPRSFAHYVANFEMQMEAPTLWTMDNQFDHKASGVRAAFSCFWSKSNWSCKKKCITSSAAFFHAKFQISNNSRARHVKVYILPLCVHFNYKIQRKLKMKQVQLAKRTLERKTHCMSVNDITFVALLAQYSFMNICDSVKEARGRPEYSQTHSHIPLQIFLHLSTSPVCRRRRRRTHFFFLPIKCIPFSHTSSYYKARLFIRRWGIRGGRGCWGVEGYFWTPASLW